MTEVVFQAIGAILAADIALLIAYLAKISPENEQCRLERRQSLDLEVYSTISELQTTEITINSLLPLFKEYQTIEKWEGVLRQTCANLGYSIFLVLVGLFFCLFDSIIALEGVPVEALFVVGGGIYFLIALYTIINHAIEVYKWKASENME